MLQTPRSISLFLKIIIEFTSLSSSPHKLLSTPPPCLVMVLGSEKKSEAGLFFPVWKDKSGATSRHHNNLGFQNSYAVSQKSVEHVCASVSWCSFPAMCAGNACSTHSLHQYKLCAANQSSVDPQSFLSEHTDALLQPPLLHLCCHIILQSMEGMRLLNVTNTKQPHRFTAWILFYNTQHYRGARRAHLPHTVGKKESHVVAHLSDEGERLLMVVLCFATEAWDEVAAEAHVCHTNTTNVKQTSLLGYFVWFEN